MNKKLLVLDAIIATIVSIVGIHLFLAVVPVPWDFCAKGYANWAGKEGNCNAFWINRAKAYAHSDKRPRFDVDLAALVAAHLHLLQERGKLILVVWGSSRVLLFFRPSVNILLVV